MPASAASTSVSRYPIAMGWQNTCSGISLISHVVPFLVAGLPFVKCIKAASDYIVVHRFGAGSANEDPASPKS